MYNFVYINIYLGVKTYGKFNILCVPSEPVVGKPLESTNEPLIAMLTKV
mgnify:CR=1 FL=1